MSENQDQPATTPGEQPEQEAPKPVLTEGIKDSIREHLKKFRKSNQKTISGSEAPAEGQPADAAPVSAGRDVDWSEYDIPYSLRHLYPQATYRQTPDGPHWVAMVDEFYSSERDFRSHGKRVNVPGTTDGKSTEPLNLGEYLNDMLNSPEGWRLVSVLPSGTGKAGIVLQRQVPVVLPDPTPLKKEAEVAAPTDEELSRVEQRALEFARTEGLNPDAVAEGDRAADALAGDDFGVAPIVTEQPAHVAAEGADYGAAQDEE